VCGGFVEVAKVDKGEPQLGVDAQLTKGLAGFLEKRQALPVQVRGRLGRAGAESGCGEPRRPRARGIGASTVRRSATPRS
jgi:hypothetical protein